MYCTVVGGGTEPCHTCAENVNEIWMCDFQIRKQTDRLRQTDKQTDRHADHPTAAAK